MAKDTSETYSQQTLKSSEIILESLKSNLKLRGLSYKDLAKAWKISESSVKRVMSSKDISLARIESACQLMELPVGDFYRQIHFEKHTDIFYLTREQELKLSKDPDALHYFLLLQQGDNPSEIVKRYSISAEKNIRILNQLERLKLIEVHPQNRIKRHHMGQLRFRKDGSLGKELERLVKAQFLEADFGKEDDYFTFLNLTFIPGEPQKMKLKFREIFKDLIQTSEENRKHPNAQDYGILMAIREWQSPFTKALPLRKSQK